MVPRLLKNIFCIFGFSVVLVGCINSKFQNNDTNLNNETCYKTFQEFSYAGSSTVQTNEKNILHPLIPWEEENLLPPPLPGYYHDQSYVEISRNIKSEVEIWVKDIQVKTDLFPREQVRFFHVYHTQKKQWVTISAQIFGTNLFVDQLFVVNGEIFGMVVFSASMEIDMEEIPILSRLNENTLEFEFVENFLTISNPEITSISYIQPVMVLDPQDTLWIFKNMDGVYKISLSQGSVEKISDLPNENILSAAASQDGSIYFQRYNDEIYTPEHFFRIPDESIFVIDPITNQITALQVPENWPIFNGMVVDRNNQLWLGSTGYRNKKNEWVLIYPDTDQYFDQNAGDISYAPAKLIRETSDGRLWFTKYTDNLRIDGTAWYDPILGKGCMVTNVPSNVIESSNGYLWIIVDGKLFKNPLGE